MVATTPTSAQHLEQDADVSTARLHGVMRVDVPSSRLHQLHDRIEDWLAGYPDTLPVRLCASDADVLVAARLGTDRG
jgi:hypothetical protein